MFMRTQEGPAACVALRCLRLSLNSPVLAIEELPVGPAAACIAVHGPPGAPGLVLALRSGRSGQLAFFAPEAAAPLADIDLALEAAASFAEAMGFLFDEDVMADARDPGAVERRWREFLAEPELPETSPAALPHGRVLSKFRFNRAATSPATRQGASSPGPAARG
jgi:hypothetical protein